ncbi:hypothetical protein [Hyunsoonleella ulvae]|uniref:hypothetical protein n=1 Tax=Hyunsoonleella ulvae TaxID=2799948 RepID=UPI00193A51B3|nr:hypothetical protein [Hyunsoonleella ulvae]
MKNTKNTFLKVISAMTIILALVCTSNLSAQTGPPTGPQDTVDNSGVPLDGGLAILIIGAASAIGIKKYRDSNK